ncbi:MAG: DUF6514 family protein [Clostridiales bacterium]|nr:DUF6514 family protein [Clostridiales bacterium]
MAYTYCMRKDTIHDEERKEYTVYGIEAVGSDGKIISSFPDVFFDIQKAEHFVDLCNAGGLSPIHLADAVEDALAEQYTA